MATATVERIREAALELFSSYWFESVSVAQICRRAGVSNGVYYRYYRNKDELFEYLLDDFLKRFGADLDGVGGADRSERLSSFVATVSGAARRYAGQVTMFREGQYRRPVYEQQLRELYVAALQRVLGRSVTEAEYLFVLSGLRFIATRSLYHDLAMDDELLQRILERGVFPEARKVPLVEAPPPAEHERAGDSGEALVAAGLRLLGKQDFFSVQVSDIAREAGFSVGTFYKRFESKERFLAEVVRVIGRDTRHYLTLHAPDHGTRLDRELLGMGNVLSYFGHHRECYDIVREAEFVVPEAVKAYYDAFERGYTGTLTGYPEQQRPLVANFLMGLYHYLGIEVLFSSRVQDPHRLIEELGELLAHGTGDT
ncbi:MAG: TetR/AcrR family transcriptional regulator [Spirochaeta sp.]|jgi:AcrR family transcriptional regulator|nr:TetR/AcrR family transcriptional regulator [Spirochaeta sp.]